MNTQDLIAIDTHTHAEVSCWNPFDAYGDEYDRAADKYFGSNRRPTIDQTVAYYREKKIGLVMFTVDAESQLGRRPIYDVIAEHKLPAIFHSGHSGIGSGMRCGGGLRLQNSRPMLLEDVALNWPDIQVVIAHPSWPWQDEALSLALHKPNVWIDLSGWSPKYFPPQLVQYANTLLKDRMLFGSDYPLITPERWMADFEQAGFKDQVRPLILKENAKRLLGLA